MKHTLISRAVRRSLALSPLFAAAVWSVPAGAQQAPAAEPTQEVTVVGSRIRRVEAEGPTPVVTINAEDFEKRGYATVTEALNDLSQNAGGGFDQQNTFGFVPSASAIDLRGFGAGRTLVLLDGRRQPVFPLANGGTDNFVDLSSIPVGAIERVEVLTDGASAIYGSDAVSGVVNVVLKKQADNALAARLSDTAEGGGGQQRIQFSAGTDNLAGGTASFFAEFFKQKELMFTDRDYSRSDRLGGIDSVDGPGIFSSFGDPGTFIGFPDDPDADLVLVPASNCSTEGEGPGVQGGFCRFNRAPYRQLVPSFDQYSATGRYERPVTDNMSFFSRATYFHSVTDTQLEPMAYDQGGTDGFGILTPVGAGANPTSGADAVPGVWRRRMTEFGPRQEEVTNNTINLLAGVRGELADRFNWEFGVSYIEQRTVSINNNFVRKSDMNALVYGQDLDGDGIGDGGTLNLFNEIPQSVVDQLRISPRGDGISSLGGADFQFDGDLFTFAGRTVKFASILEFNKQRFADLRDQEVLDGDVVALGGTNGRGDRKYSAFGTELEVPVFENFIVNVAGRFDSYDDDSDVGSAFSPRIAMEYRPVQRLLFRGSAGKSFRAPDLQRLFGGETAAFIDVIDTPKCIEDGGSGRGDASVPTCVQQSQSIATTIVGSTELTEEKGENFNFGIVFEPFSGVTLSTDVFYITLKQIVNTPSSQFILDANAADGSFADDIQRDPAAEGLQNPGGIVDIRAAARNLSFQRMSGVDVRGDVRIPTDGFGNFTARIAATYLNDLKIQELPGDPTINVLADADLGEFVRFRGTAEVGWNRGIFGANVLVSHIGGFTPLDPTAVERIGSWTTVNVGGTVDTPWNSTFALGVNNVFDKDPPLDLSLGDAGQPFYNQFFHDPFGATWHVTYTQRF
jgi:iron complex outermembrane recepter protein